MSSVLHQQNKAILDLRLKLRYYRHQGLLHRELHHYHYLHHNIWDSKDLVQELLYREQLGTTHLRRDRCRYRRHHYLHNLNQYRNCQVVSSRYHHQDRRYYLSQNNPKYHLNHHLYPNGRKYHQSHHLNQRYH